MRQACSSSCRRSELPAATPGSRTRLQFGELYGTCWPTPAAKAGSTKRSALTRSCAFAEPRRQLEARGLVPGRLFMALAKGDFNTTPPATQARAMTVLLILPGRRDRADLQSLLAFLRSSGEPRRMGRRLPHKAALLAPADRPPAGRGAARRQAAGRGGGGLSHEPEDLSRRRLGADRSGPGAQCPRPASPRPRRPARRWPTCPGRRGERRPQAGDVAGSSASFGQLQGRSHAAADRGYLTASQPRFAAAAPWHALPSIAEARPPTGNEWVRKPGVAASSARASAKRAVCSSSPASVKTRR